LAPAVLAGSSRRGAEGRQRFQQGLVWHKIADIGVARFRKIARVAVIDPSLNRVEQGNGKPINPALFCRDRPGKIY